MAPEFQLVTESSVGGYLNYMQNVINTGINSSDIKASYTTEFTLVIDAATLVRRLNTMPLPPISLLSSLQHQSRRAFLKRSGQLAMTGTALPFALNLAAMGEAAAFNSSSNDYKALVCMFLYGGNDYANTVVTYDDPSYNQYSTIRGGGANQTAGGIAHAKAALAATLLVPTTAPLDSLGVARQYALHPSMTGLAALFNAGKAAVQLNVGPLVKPLTRARRNSSRTTTSSPSGNRRPPKAPPLAGAAMWATWLSTV